jgi:hypothetical protein
LFLIAVIKLLFLTAARAADVRDLSDSSQVLRDWYSVASAMYDDLDTDERPLVLTWELTQACELACKHCQAEADPLCAFVPERYDGPLPDAWGGTEQVRGQALPTAATIT